MQQIKRYSLIVVIFVITIAFFSWLQFLPGAEVFAQGPTPDNNPRDRTATLPPDRDLDGTTDHLDLCPDVPGDGANYGCPIGFDPFAPTSTTIPTRIISSPIPPSPTPIEYCSGYQNTFGINQFIVNLYLGDENNYLCADAVALEALYNSTGRPGLLDLANNLNSQTFQNCHWRMPGVVKLVGRIFQLEDTQLTDSPTWRTIDDLFGILPKDPENDKKCEFADVLNTEGADWIIEYGDEFDADQKSKILPLTCIPPIHQDRYSTVQGELVDLNLHPDYYAQNTDALCGLVEDLNVLGTVEESIEAIETILSDSGSCSLSQHDVQDALVSIVESGVDRTELLEHLEEDGQSSCLEAVQSFLDSSPHDVYPISDSIAGLDCDQALLYKFDTHLMEDDGDEVLGKVLASENLCSTIEHFIETGHVVPIRHDPASEQTLLITSTPSNTPDLSTITVTPMSETPTPPPPPIENAVAMFVGEINDNTSLYRLEEGSPSKIDIDSFPEGEILQLAFQPSGNSVLFLQEEGSGLSLKEYDPSEDNPIRTILSSNNSIVDSPLALSPSGRVLFLTMVSAGELSLFAVDLNRPELPPRYLFSNASAPNSSPIQRRSGEEFYFIAYERGDNIYIAQAQETFYTIDEIVITEEYDTAIVAPELGICSNPAFGTDFFDLFLLCERDGETQIQQFTGFSNTEGGGVGDFIEIPIFEDVTPQNLSPGPEDGWIAYDDNGIIYFTAIDGDIIPLQYPNVRISNISWRRELGEFEAP